MHGVHFNYYAHTAYISACQTNCASIQKVELRKYLHRRSINTAQITKAKLEDNLL